MIVTAETLQEGAPGSGLLRSQADPVGILGIGTALPENRIGQDEARELVKALFAGMPGLERMLSVFENTGIVERWLAQPPGWYGQNHSFEEKNKRWFEAALRLAKEASHRALNTAGLKAREVGGVVLVTTTGIATPSLEAYLMQELGIAATAIRLPIWGLGCAGGAAGLARAADLARVHGKPILMIAAELCSLTFIPGDRSKSNIVATSLFGDGAAAVVVGPTSAAFSEGGSRGYPQIVAGLSQLLPNSYQVMGWDLHPGGLQVRFAQSIPALVQGRLAGLLEGGLESFGLKLSHIQTFVLHPGGAKVLAAYQEALPVSQIDIQASWQVLRHCGNMSSPTALFVLEQVQQQMHPPGNLGLLLALGPGFAAEGVLLKW
jgi:alkylresorcinol/alkylpyrone synthase